MKLLDRGWVRLTCTLKTKWFALKRNTWYRYLRWSTERKFGPIQ